MANTVLLFLLGFLMVSIVQGDFTCTSDSDCLLTGYHCCTGSIYCCPDGYVCTGGATCISIGVIVGPIVGGVVLIVSCIVGCICYNRRRRLPPPTVYAQQAPTTVAYGQQAYGQPQAYGQQNYK
ncbi:uncharacterized protein LOC134264718 isoform X1 [Saccostrea cucullata]|uniref:uncharacterized protein LOC134264718 isoform X1 n=1 Tax=Saccostrea cuccullata TaxID=36930 RepID=UPI002ED1298A